MRLTEDTAEEAQTHGLPPFSFCVDVTGTSLSLKKFAPDRYLMASGPPGGPLLVRVFPADGHEGDVNIIEQAVRRHFVKPFHQPLVIGETGEFARTFTLL